MGFFTSSPPNYDSELIDTINKKKILKNHKERIIKRYKYIKNILLKISLIYGSLFLIGIILTLYYNLHITNIIIYPTICLFDIFSIDSNEFWPWIVTGILYIIIIERSFKFMNILEKHHISSQDRKINKLKEKQNMMLKTLKKALSDVDVDGLAGIFEEPIKKRLSTTKKSFENYNTRIGNSEMVRIICRLCKTNNGECSLDYYMQNRKSIRCKECGECSLIYL